MYAHLSLIEIKQIYVINGPLFPILKRSTSSNKTGMRFFRNFPEFQNFHDLRGHYRGTPRFGLIFMGGGGGGTINCVFAGRL